MNSAPLGELAEINPRMPAPPADEPVSFVGMAQLSATDAVAVPLETRLFRDASKGYTVFRNGDILAAKITPCWENGKVGQARLRHAIGVGSTEFHVIRPSAHVDARYVMHFLRQENIRLDGERRMTGSGGQRRIPKGYLEQLLIPLPELSEQRRIASILDQADALRAKRREQLALLDALPQAIFHEMFLNPEPAGRVARLAEIAEVTSGITKGRRTALPVSPVPYLAVANVQDGALDMSNVKIIDATDAEIARYLLKPGDVVVTEGGDPDKLGRGTIWRGELDACLHQNHIFRIRLHASSEVRPEYLASFMRTRIARAYFLQSAKQTTGIASINMSQLKQLPVTIPPLAEQDRYLCRVDSTTTLDKAASAARSSSDSVFTSLQSRAFRGEL